MGRRRSAKKDIETDSDESLFKAPVTKPKRKKRKVATSKDDGAQQHDSKALLQLMVNMPVDILLEIFKHLGLIDLMHLSRTSKALRSILMSRTSIAVWKQTVANDGLPPCTNDLNEPQLAELIFGRSCDWCGRNVSGQEIIWAARVRACKRCIELTWSEGATRGHFIGDRGYPAELTKHLPSVVVRNTTYVDADLDREWRDEYITKQSRVEELKWLEARVAERRVISDHAAACQRWFKSRREAHVMLRKALIIERLKERGWGEEIDQLAPGSGPTDGLTEVVKACQSDLTEPILAALDDALDKFMEKVKAARIAREKKQFFKAMLERLREISREYSKTLPANHIFPNTADIYFHPTVNTALSAVESYEALEEVLTRIQPSLPEVVDDCLKLSKQHLTNLVIDDYTQHNKSFDLSVLTLASTLFLCRTCQRDLTLDQTVVHECRHTYYYNLSDDMQTVHSAIKEVTTAHKIQSTISFSLAQLEPFATVLHSCGIDPNTTTVADMNEVDPVIECLSCSNIEQGRVTMRWLSVSRHFRPFHTINVSVLGEPEAEIVRARMLEQYQKDTAKSQDHICVHCKNSGGSMTLLQHVKQDHHIDSPVYGQDVVASLRSSAFRKEFHLWPPKL